MLVDIGNVYVHLLNVQTMKCVQRNVICICMHIYVYLYIMYADVHNTSTILCILYTYTFNYIYVYIYGRIHTTHCTCPSRMLNVCENRAKGYYRLCLKWISIPYEDKLMLLLRSNNAQKGWWMLIPNKDNLMLVLHSTCCSTGWRIMMPHGISDISFKLSNPQSLGTMYWIG